MVKFNVNNIWNKISLKIIVIVSIILLLSMLLAGVYFIRTERAILFEEAHAKAVSLNKSIERLLLTMVTFGILDVENVLKDAMKGMDERDVYSIKLIHSPDLAATFMDKQFAEKYKVMRDSEPQNEIEQKLISGQVIEDRILINVNGKQQPFIRYGSPIRVEKSCLACHDTKVGKTLGAFFSLISLEKGYQVIKNRTIYNILLFILGFIFILTALYLSLRKIVLRPIINISKAAQHIIEKQDLLKKVEVISDDEIGQLGIVFNEMVADLKKSRDGLEDWAKTLEKRVTERTKDLEKAKSYTEDIIGSMSDTLIVADSSGEIKMINPALVELLGYSQDELIGKPVTSIFDAETAKVFSESAIKEILGEQLTKNHEAVYKTKIGQGVAVSFSVSLMRGALNNTPDMIIVSKDIREIKHLLEMEKQKAVELREAYGKLQALQDALIQAEKLNAIGRLASGVAHEVKNPLGIIKQSAEYLNGKLLPTAKNAPEALRMIQDNIERADNIIRVLLDFSRVTKLDRKLEDINVILENSLVLIQHRASTLHIKIIRELAKDLPRVSVDKGKMEQVFINLLLNAIQAMPEGGDIFLRTYQKQFDKTDISVEVLEKNHFKQGDQVVVIEIEDTGKGISEENLKKVLEPFFTTKEPGQGTGLGLSISTNILNMHGGRLEMESQEGKGTKVIVTLNIIEDIL